MNEAGEVGNLVHTTMNNPVLPYLELCESVDSEFVLGVRLRDLKGTFIYSIERLNVLP